VYRTLLCRLKFVLVFAKEFQSFGKNFACRQKSPQLLGEFVGLRWLIEFISRAP
jgi:hypothetical protein